MDAKNRYEGRSDYLDRLPDECYRGQAYVHWSMTIANREAGWLTSNVHCEFRQVLIHTLFRCGICCPVYCCMSDHIHLLWVGIFDQSDQRNAAKFFRRQLNLVLQPSGVRLQQQPYDHVLRDEEKLQTAFEAVVEYIARNPERAGLVQPDKYRDYPYTDSLVPGCPELHLWQPGFWPRFWRIHSYNRQRGLVRLHGEPP
jgi:REP element-mobilizing transposase RayT